MIISGSPPKNGLTPQRLRASFRVRFDAFVTATVEQVPFSTPERCFAIGKKPLNKFSLHLLSRRNDLIGSFTASKETQKTRFSGTVDFISPRHPSENVMTGHLSGTLFFHMVLNFDNRRNIFRMRKPGKKELAEQIMTKDRSIG